MAITVKQMIAKLKKMPQSAKVAVCNHDQDAGRGEMDGTVSGIEEAPEALRERGYGVVINL